MSLKYEPSSEPLHISAKYLTTLAELEGLPPEGALVDLALVGPREGHAVRLVCV